MHTLPAPCLLLFGCLAQLCYEVFALLCCFIVCLFGWLVDWLMAVSGRPVFLPYRLSPFLEVWVCFHVMMPKFLPPLFVCTLKITS